MRVVTKDNGRKCPCCNLLNFYIVPELCMIERGCQCECPRPESKRRPKRVEVEEVEDKSEQALRIGR